MIGVHFWYLHTVLGISYIVLSWQSMKDSSKPESLTELVDIDRVTLLSERNPCVSFLDHGYGSGPFSNKSNYFFKTPGATFFSNSSGWRSLNRQEINQSLRQLASATHSQTY
jgi:hypothetical protein